VSRQRQYAGTTDESNKNLKPQGNRSTASDNDAGGSLAEQRKNAQAILDEAGTKSAQRIPPPFPSEKRIRCRRRVLYAIAILVLLITWIIASHYFPETMHLVRRWLLLIAIGGPDG
jgi:hypothetical protein